MPKRDLPRTEAVNPVTKGIDAWSASSIVQAMSAEDHRVAPAVAREIPRIVEAVELVARAIRDSKRVLYAGAGTSGRLGILDASEMEPTFGAPGVKFTAIIAGGPEAAFRSIEGAEDNADAGRDAVAAAGVGPGDVVVGIASSGRTPFVAGALEAAKEGGGSTVAIVGDPSGPVAAAADVVIAPDVGPEVIAGSTRLKNGTAQKMVLNMMSTAAMILAGRTYSNLMAGASPRNAKLSGRARRILAGVTGRPPEEIEAALVSSGGDISLALISLESGVSPEQAARTLVECRRSIPDAVRAAVSAGKRGGGSSGAAGYKGETR
jgi:N-acetylmuramic acid 6-phosphate etherase